MGNYISTYEYASHVPDVGEQVHVNHEDCPAGTDNKRRLYIKNDGEKILVYCHNCGGSAVKTSASYYNRWYFSPDLGADAKHLINILDVDKPIIDGSITLPDDVEPIGINIPFECCEWLASNNMSYEDCGKYGICYSPSYNRVILPVFNPDTGDLIYWQARDCTGKAGPKYINIKGVPKPLYILKPESPVVDRVIIVEDILSAIALHKLSVTKITWENTVVIALLGTKIGVEHLLDYCDNHMYIYIWLDNDEAGKLGAIDLRQNLSIAFHENRHRIYVVNAEQPKKLCIDDIEDALRKSRK